MDRSNQLTPRNLIKYNDKTIETTIGANHFALTESNDPTYKFILLYEGDLSVFKERTKQHPTFKNTTNAEMLLYPMSPTYDAHIYEKLKAVPIRKGQIEWDRNGYLRNPEQDTMNFLNQYSKRIILDKGESEEHGHQIT